LTVSDIGRLCKRLISVFNGRPWDPWCAGAWKQALQIHTSLQSPSYNYSATVHDSGFVQ